MPRSLATRRMNTRRRIILATRSVQQEEEEQQQPEKSNVDWDIKGNAEWSQLGIKPSAHATLRAPMLTPLLLTPPPKPPMPLLPPL